MSIDNQVKEAVLVVAKAQVAEALGGDVLGKIVTDVLNHRPSSSYSSNPQPTVLESIIRDQVRAVAQAAVREALNEPVMQEQIKTAVIAKADTFATAIVTAFATEDWRANLTVHLEGDR